MKVGRILATAAVSALSLVAFAAPASADNGHDAWKNDKVYVVDKSGSEWPVGRAAESLDNNSPLDLVHVSKCPAKAQCIYVDDVRDIPNGDPDYDTAGDATTWLIGTRITRAEVRLNDKWGNKNSFNDRLFVACHEIGHAVGLDHVNRKSTCMHTYANNGASSKPDAKTEARLRSAY